jgi:hypothetical protein
VRRARRVRGRKLGALSVGPTSASDPLIVSAHGLLDELLPWLQDECTRADDKPFRSSHPFGRWTRDEAVGSGDHRMYTFVAESMSAEQVCVERILGELWQAGDSRLLDVHQAMEQDAVLGPRLDHAVVSAGAGGGTWQALQLVRQLFVAGITQTGGFDLDQAGRDALVEGWVARLRQRSELITVLVVLSEFDAEALPIQLEGNLVLDELTDEEIGVALTLGGSSSLWPGSTFVGRTMGMRTSYESELFVDAVPPEDQDRDVAAREAAFEEAMLLLLALRLFKASPVGQRGSFTYGGANATSVSGSLNTRLWPPSQPYFLTAGETVEFSSFWKLVRSVHGKRVIAPALRRFGYAADRSRPDDEIVDLLIAAESLFLTDTGRERDRGEMRFRLSIRVSSLLGSTPEERMRLAAFMRKAYDVRSTIVHGGDIRVGDIPTLADESPTVESFADELEEILRRSLKVAISRVASGEGFPPNWDELLFRATAS